MVRSILLNTALAFAAIYLLLCGALFFAQEKLLFFPDVLSANYTFEHPGRHKEAWLTTKSGSRIHALHFTVTNPKGAVLYLHGNGGSLRSWGRVAEPLNAAGYDVFLPDYPGYGKSSGSLNNENQLHETAALAYAHLKTTNPEANITVVGRSLGTGIATRLAKENRPRALVLISPYTSIAGQALRRFPFLPPFLVKYALPTERWIGGVRCPVTLIHGTRDEVIPYSCSQELLPLIRSSGKLVTVDGAGHNDLQNSPEYKDAMAATLP
ncbi:MAG: alpha/beta fold hydrolase [Fibrella sp.]|nr:alpha/beta fold hydrolase [Armatimonadota bacterium]